MKFLVNNFVTERVSRFFSSFSRVNLDFYFISTASDLPLPISGVVNLLPNVTYYITSEIDLLGSRIVCGENTVILGASSENSIIRSTGLVVGVPLITSNYTVPIRHIAFVDIDTCFDFNGLGNTMALDWTGVNIVNCPNIGEFKNFQNFIFSKGAFINSQGLIFDEVFDTASFDNCLFSGNGASGSLINILPTATINRRFRIVYSAVVAFGSTSGLIVSTSANVPVEGFILDTVNFSGGGSYIIGVQYNDNKALFVNCKGINNSRSTAHYYTEGNAITTVIESAEVPVKVLGASLTGEYNEKFTITDNRATYIGALDATFKATSSMTIISGNNNQIGAYIAKNGVIINNSETYVTASGTGRAENIFTQTIIEMGQGDYLELFVENNTGANDILVTDLNLIVN